MEKKPTNSIIQTDKKETAENMLAEQSLQYTFQPTQLCSLPYRQKAFRQCAS